MTTSIKHIKDLPYWFELKKYDKAGILGAAGWYEQLSIRNDLYNILIRKSLDGFIISKQDLKVLEELREDPIVDVNNSELMKVLFCGGELLELKTGNPLYTLGVHMTSVREHYLTENNIQDEKRTYARNFFNQMFDGNLFKEPYEHLKYPCQDWIDQPIDNIRSSLDFNVHINIDMGLPDNVLIA